MAVISNTPFDRRSFLGAAGLGALGTAIALGSGKSAAAAAFPVRMTDTQWKAKLGAPRFAVMRRESTERPYSSPLNKEKRRGTFACAGCGQALFSSATKFDSGTGWPSFWQALPRAVGYKKDTTLFMTRTEEHCSRCGGHLGHVFDDGPKPTGKRHCINGLSLTFRPA